MQVSWTPSQTYSRVPRTDFISGLQRFTLTFERVDRTAIWGGLAWIGLAGSTEILFRRLPFFETRAKDGISFEHTLIRYGPQVNISASSGIFRVIYRNPILPKKNGGIDSQGGLMKYGFFQDPYRFVLMASVSELLMHFY